MSAIERMPPSSIEAEEAVIGSILIDPGALKRVQQLIGASDFYLVKHQWVFEACVELSAQSEPIDFVTVRRALQAGGRLDEIGGPGALSRLINIVPTAIHAEGYARIVLEMSQNRGLLALAYEAARLAYLDGDAPIDDKVSRLAAGLSALRRSRSEARNLSAVLDELWTRAESWAETPLEYGQVRGVPSGLKDIDAMLGGFDPGNFYIISGRPGMGKSVLAYQIAKNAAQAGKRVVVYSLEMTDFQVAARLVCGECGVTYRDVKEGKLDGEQWAKLIQAVATLRDLPLILNDHTSTTTSSIAADAAETRPDLIVVDHFHLLKDVIREDPVQRLGKMAMALKDISKNADCPVISVVQLSRAVESRQDKRPLMSDLRESGRIEEAADVILALYREDYYDPQTVNRNIAEVLIRKFRDGQGDSSAELFFDKAHSRFYDLTRRELSP